MGTASQYFNVRWKVVGMNDSVLVAVGRCVCLFVDRIVYV